MKERMRCELHRCDREATIIFKWSDRQLAACDGHATEFYRLSQDETPIRNITDHVEANAKIADGGFEFWRKRLYQNLGKQVSPKQHTGGMT